MDDLLSNHVDLAPPRRGRIGRYFQNRTVAEMSIWFWIVAVSSLIIGTLSVVKVLSWIGGPGVSGDTVKTGVILAGIVLWLGFLAWLWVLFVRTARGWGPERLGMAVFRYLQIGLFIFTILMVLPVIRRDFKAIFYAILMFDFVIMGMVAVFLSLVWCARCRVPWSAYYEILAMIALFVLQIILIA